MADYDLWSEIRSKTKQLDYSVRELRKSGTAYAEAEKTYKIKLREWCLRLRSQDMPIGLIDKTCYGIPEIAELRFKRDCAQAVYRANLEAINAIKLEIKIINEQLGRELGRPGMGTGSM
jgi:hypothetical protein